MKKKSKHHLSQLVAGCAFLVIGVALVAANIGLPSEKASLVEGVLLIALGGYLLSSLVWEV